MEAPLPEPAKKALGVNLCNEAVFCDACTLHRKYINLWRYKK